MTAAAAPIPQPPPAPAAPSLRHRAIRSAGWTIVGYGFGESFRFVSNLLLTWLLVPQVFGLMALVNAAMYFLQMFSDIGLGPNIIQSRRGHEQVFLNTAWTIQVLRGVGIWLIACLIAYPCAVAMDQPMLAVLLPVVGLNAILNGFNSTALFTLNRRLVLGKLTLMQIGTQVLGMIVMVGYAWFIERSVWALVCGGFVTSLVTLLVSHRLDPTERNRFQFDKDAARELYRLGRWLFISTILTAVASRVQVPMMDLMLGTAILGVYWNAYQLAEFGPTLVNRLGGVVGFPALADIHRRDLAQFHRRFRQMRLALALPANVLLLAMIYAAPFLILIVFPPRFADMSWIVAFLCINSLAGMVNSTYGHAYFAMGHTWRVMVVVAAQGALTIAACAVGFHLAGSFGFLVGLSLVQWLLYPVHAMLASGCGLWNPRLDAAVLTASALAATGWLLIEKVLFPA